MKSLMRVDALKDACQDRSWRKAVVSAYADGKKAWNMHVFTNDLVKVEGISWL